MQEVHSILEAAGALPDRDFNRFMHDSPWSRPRCPRGVPPPAELESGIERVLTTYEGQRDQETGELLLTEKALKEIRGVRKDVSHAILAIQLFLD